MDLISRKAALASGKKRYFTGIPCKRGHISERLVRTAECYECRLVWHRRKDRGLPPLVSAARSTVCARRNCVNPLPPRHRRWCSKRCKKLDDWWRYPGKRAPKNYGMTACAADRCSNQFKPTCKHHRFCSERCKQRAERLRRREGNIRADRRRGTRKPVWSDNNGGKWRALSSREGRAMCPIARRHWHLKVRESAKQRTRKFRAAYLALQMEGIIT